MSKVEVIVSESSKKDARKLDDAKERTLIRRERLLDQSDNLNEFEQLVKEEKIKLDELPQYIINAQVGSTVDLDRGHGAYEVIILHWEELDQPIHVDLDCTRSPVGGLYKMIFQGPVTQITYRHPETDRLQVSRSELIHFAVLERKDKIVAFYDHRV